MKAKALVVGSFTDERPKARFPIGGVDPRSRNTYVIFTEDSRDRMNQMSDPFLIFIVDDESSIAETTAHILHWEGFHCAPFSDPLDLIDHCAATPPNLVISDIIMPQMSGFDLETRLRDTHPQCKILLFTG